MLLALFAGGTLAGGCHTMVPLAPDYSKYAPTLAPPLEPRIPGEGTSVGYLAPNFKLVNLSGRETQLSDYRGRPVMLNFWTYCEACKKELPYIQKAFDGRAALAPDLTVLAINVSQPPEQIREFVNFYGFTFDFLLDSWATAASDYYIYDIPTTLFIDKNGIIADVQVGAFSGTDAIIKKLSTLANR